MLHWAGKILDTICHGIDRLLVVLSIMARRKPTPGLVGIFFHGIFDPAGTADPQERVSLESIDSLINNIHSLGFKFTTPTQIETRLRFDKNLALLCSDDGYASLKKLVPVLEKHSVPITIFIVSHHAETGEAYWWDSLNKHKLDGGLKLPSKASFIDTPQSKKERDTLLALNGIYSRKAQSEGERIFSPIELSDLSKHPLIELGNHSHSHLSMENLDEDKFRAELGCCSKKLYEWTGKSITSFAFPYGNWDFDCVNWLKQEKISWAFITEPGRKHYQSINNTPELPKLLPRYQFRGDRSVWWQARIIHYGITAGFNIRHWIIRKARKYMLKK